MENPTGADMSFGGNLRFLRAEAVLSRAERARRVGIPVGTPGHWENDRGFPGVPAFMRLAEALGVSPEKLAKGVEDPAGDEPPAAIAKAPPGA
jgi:transcriptional regulator with XRE-family HTH domain